jgi:hypothetical protein
MGVEDRTQVGKGKAVAFDMVLKNWQFWGLNSGPHA